MEFDSSAPIWRQLVDEFTRRIVCHEWAPGAKLPGVREIAAALGVNPNTAQRALAELEREGLCRSERTTGRFVTENQDRIDAARADLARSAADTFVDRALGLGMRKAQAKALIEQRWSNHDSDQTSSEGA
ncbi:GntR family transcriptional regulator [uncultured Agrococcus sp.]|uniref:GntR family transcriptional regulator n=1 Tax=uncultured Agrococcus sp. TaxID=382258 RepID=UPI0025CED111|nr:GntR family transcriptional regulator [uncultured Agrococcus sp.]